MSTTPTTPQPCALWTPDCQGKQDYDGPLLTISTRYWPGPGGGGTITFDTRTAQFGTRPYGNRPSAKSSILLRVGPCETENDRDSSDYLVWREQEFEADTEAEVKVKVEGWVAVQMAGVVDALGGTTSFKRP